MNKSETYYALQACIKDIELEMKKEGWGAEVLVGFDIAKTIVRKVQENYCSHDSRTTSQNSVKTPSSNDEPKSGDKTRARTP